MSRSERHVHKHVHTPSLHVLTTWPRVNVTTYVPYYTAAKSFSRLNYSRTRIYLYTSCIIRNFGSGNQTNNTQAAFRPNRTDYRFFGVDIFVSLYLNGRGKLKIYGFLYRVLIIEYEYFDDRVQFRDSEYRVFCSPSTRIVGRVRVLRHSSTSTSTSTLKMVLE